MGASLPGVVLFDNPFRHDTGWSCLPGESAQRIKSASQLSSKTVWITNLYYRNFRESGFKFSNRYRCEDFFRTHLGTIAEEVGALSVLAPVRETKGAECTQRLADLFGNIMEAARRMGVAGTPIHSLRRGFREALLPQVSERTRAEVAAAVFAACQPYTLCERRLRDRPNSSRELRVQLVRHRSSHAGEVLSNPVPAGRWRTIKGLSAEQIIAHERPLLIRCRIHETDSILGALVNFGGTQGRQLMRGEQVVVDGTPREWLTQPEFAYLSRRSSIQILELLEAERYEPNPLLGAGLERFGPLQSLSYAFQFAAESLWTSPFKNLNDFADCSPLAAWMQTHDRILCIEEALALISKHPDVDVISLGYGRIVAQIPHPGSRYSEAFAALIEGTPLLPPLCIDCPWDLAAFNEADPVQISQAIALHGDASALGDDDQAAIEEWDRKSAAPAELCRASG